MIVGGEPLSMEPTYPEFRAPRAYTEPEEAELVSVNVARVVGIVDPGDHALDESSEGRSVRIYYEVPIVIGKRVPWIDNGSRRYAAHTKQQQSLLRWKTLEVDKLECAVSKRTHGSSNAIAVTRARSHVADQLCHRYSRPGYRVCDCEQLAAWRLPSPLLGNAARSDSPALQRPVLRRSQIFYSRNRATSVTPQSPITVRAPPPPPPPPPPPAPTPWRQHFGSASTAPWMRLQRALRAHRDMAMVLGMASEEVRREFETTQHVIERTMANVELSDEDDYGYSLTTHATHAT